MRSRGETFYENSAWRALAQAIVVECASDVECEACLRAVMRVAQSGWPDERSYEPEKFLRTFAEESMRARVRAITREPAAAPAKLAPELQGLLWKVLAMLEGV